MKRLAARALDRDIFTQGLICRDDAGWQLTAAGFDLLRKIEATPAEIPETVAPAAAAHQETIEQRPTAEIIHLHKHRIHRIIDAAPMAAITS